MSNHPDLPRLFLINRLADRKKLSGLGRVIVGVVFPDGQTVIQWQTARRSLGVYSSLKDVQDIHSKPTYENENEFQWIDGYKPSDEVIDVCDELIEYVTNSIAITDKAKGKLIGALNAVKHKHENKQRGGFSVKDIDYHRRRHASRREAGDA